MAHLFLERQYIPTNLAIAIISLGLLFTLYNASDLYQITTTVLMSWWILGVCSYYIVRRYPIVLWMMIPLSYALLVSMMIEFREDPIRLRGFMANDNHAAGLLTLGIAFMLTRKSTARRWPFETWGLLALPLALGVLMTGSRLAVLVTVFCFVVFAYQRRDLRLFALLFVVGGLSLLNADITQGLRIGSNISSDVMLRLDAGFVPDSIIGQESGWLFFHNAPMQIAYNAGIPAALAWIALMGLSIAYAVHSRSGIMLILPALLLCTLDHYFWWPGTLAPIFWGYIGATHAKA
tara:strand:+ start:76 stop:951 length:876 start_codon:yes stop_codon:yes gene_type:complete